MPRSFSKYIPDQQTRWHCGATCHASEPLGAQDLRKAMANLDNFDVVLILEDLKDPDSCSRRQMRSLLNWTQFHKDEPKIHTDDRGSRASGTKWDEQVRPNLDTVGRDQNSTVSGKLWGMTGPEVMAALGLHNSLDLQMYGYARNRCEEIAARLDVEPHETLTSHNATQTATIPFEALNEIPSFVSHSPMTKEDYQVQSLHTYTRLLEHQDDVPTFGSHSRMFKRIPTHLLEQQHNVPPFIVIEQQYAYVGLAIVCFMSGYVVASLPRRRRRHL